MRGCTGLVSLSHRNKIILVTISAPGNLLMLTDSGKCRKFRATDLRQTVSCQQVTLHGGLQKRWCNSFNKQHGTDVLQLLLGERMGGLEGGRVGWGPE